ncbi:MAG: PH domain-containing protein [Planctomycetes bacterium]|nr:PH domain-containing protein [Planctomycetota bacterium]
MKLAELQAIDRPNRKQVTLIILSAVFASVISCGFATPFALIGIIPVLIRYMTTRYRFDESGVGVSWGLFFKQESHLTFDKIQDIHLKRGLLERWLRLGTVDVQTASGSATAEVSLYGLLQYDEVRDFLYKEMRNARGMNRPTATEGEAAPAAGGDAIAILREIRDEVQRLQREVASQDGAATNEPGPTPDATSDATHAGQGGAA